MARKKGKTKKKRKKSRLNPDKLIRCICLSIALLTALGFGAYKLSMMLERRSYRFDYSNEILKYSEEYELSASLVASVVHCESSGNPDAVSKVGAIGLMQIMPDTGRWIAEKTGMEDYSEERLNEPDINIRMGCWYLRYLLDRFSGDRKKAIAAYNAGPGNVDKWMAAGKYSLNDELVMIPFPETEKYVEKVFRTDEKYKELYDLSY